MRTPASIARHPLHPMLVPFPIGLWVFSLVSDLVYAFGSHDPVWKATALYTMIGGIVRQAGKSATPTSERPDLGGATGVQQDAARRYPCCAS